MYLRVTRGRVDPAKSEEAIRLVPPIMAAIRLLPGCREAHTGIDRATGESISISNFETLEQAQFSRDLLGGAIAPLLALGWQGDPAEIYEKTE